MEYKIEPVENQLLCKIFLHLIIFNNDTVNTLYLPSIPLIIDFTSIVKTGRDLVKKTEGELIRLHNELEIN